MLGKIQKYFFIVVAFIMGTLVPPAFMIFRFFYIKSGSIIGTISSIKSNNDSSIILQIIPEDMQSVFLFSAYTAFVLIMLFLICETAFCIIPDVKKSFMQSCKNS